MQRYSAALLASLSEAERAKFLDELSENALASMPWLWELWAHPGHQAEPPGDWDTWLILGGRGAGKTRAGAEWIRSQVEGSSPLDGGAARRIALVGETIDQAREVMVEGESGILAVSPADRRPIFRSSQSKLIWPSGATALIYSAANPEALRGPQFDCAWSDELAKWNRCSDAWEMLQFCLRLGERPRQIVTTTPRDNPVLRMIMESPGTTMTHAATAANQAFLSPDFVDRLTMIHGGTALARQELDGVLLSETEGALWSRQLIETGRVREVPELHRVVVAVDPPATGGDAADACGIVVAGLHCNGRPGGGKIYVLADATIQGAGPLQWAERAVATYHSHDADRLTAEVNQGGDMVETIVRNVDPNVSYRGVRATRGKRVRAEPVAALYEQGRVHHVGLFPHLEDQMCSFTATGLPGGGSPDRLDALVWAVTDLLQDDGAAAPRVRRL